VRHHQHNTASRPLRRAIWFAAAALAAVLAFVLLAGGRQPHAARAAQAFGWLEPAPAPSGWHVAVTRSGAKLAYPPAWRQIQTDGGSVSAAPPGPDGSFVAYLNATPLGGSETLANWTRFRISHLADEGDHRVRLEAARTGLRFRAGRGSCVIDSYSTAKASFTEIACIVAGAHATTVVVAAAPVDGWAHQAGGLEKAIASFTT
jgi:hypothetical protein